MKNSLAHYIGRIQAAAHASEKNCERLEAASSRFIDNGGELAKEILRPNDKAMDLVAKSIECCAYFYDVAADYVQDAAEILPEISGLIRARRDAQGYYSLEDVKLTVKHESRRSDVNDAKQHNSKSAAA